MDHPTLARALLSFFCAVQGIATMVIDLNRTHATNADWPGHARFHLVWQVVLAALLSVFELMLLWWRGPAEDQRFYITLFLASAPSIAFLIALLGRRMYGGTLSDPNGIPSARIPMLDAHADLNLVAVVAALLSLAAILEIYRH
jgi:CDP-diglyceride synthetase